jgi:hypothetical protein
MKTKPPPSNDTELDKLAARLREIEARQTLSPMLILNEMNKFYILRKEEEDAANSFSGK